MTLRVLLLALLMVHVARAETHVRAAFDVRMQPAQTVDDAQIEALLLRIEGAVRAGDAAAYRTLLSDDADARRAAAFCQAEFRDGATRAVLKERDRAPLKGTVPGFGFRLIVDTFVEVGNRARIASWQIDVRRTADARWTVVDQQRLSAVDNLYRLSIGPAQYHARDFTVRAEDLELTLTRGSVFLVDTDRGTTGLVMLGEGVMRFEPAPATEKGQVRILAGDDVLETRFEAAFLRIGDFPSHADRSALTAIPVQPRDLRRAEAIFREESVKSFSIDLADLSSEDWSLLPGFSDIVADVRTRRFGTLTYTQSESLPEDISLFDRADQKHIALYASRARLASRGRFYDEDDLMEIDVLDHAIEVEFAPDRQFLNGRARLRIRTRAPATNQLTFRLADSLAVLTVTSDPFGRLFHMRVKGQGLVLVNLPATVLRGTDVAITLQYSGRVTPQPPDREALAVQQPGFDDEATREASYLFSNRSSWYPQGAFTDYATATLRVTVPAGFECVASGIRQPPVAAGDSALTPKTVLFQAIQPVRYLSLIVGRFRQTEQLSLPFGPAGALDVAVFASPAQSDQVRGLSGRAGDIVQFYYSILGDVPFPSLTVVAIQGSAPGGHSPGYFVVLSRPPRNAPRVWRNDPAAFDNHRDFFLAHEIAHQWWGQAVGSRNYHEQWLSEAFAQYMAALYIRHTQGEDDFSDVMRQMRRWAIDQSSQGPVSLGYRLGHIQNDGWIFRALVYDKGAAVLDMLRQLTGEQAFYAGLRTFYQAARFTKTDTVAFRLAMEASAGRPLERFFEKWIHGIDIPTIRISHRLEGSPARSALVIRVEQEGDPFDLPVTATIRYTNGDTTPVTIPVTDRVVESRIPLQNAFRDLQLERDAGTLAIVRRR